MRVVVTEVVRTVEVSDAHVAWCVAKAMEDEPRRLSHTTRRNRAVKAVADSLGVYPGDVILSLSRERT